KGGAEISSVTALQPVHYTLEDHFERQLADSGIVRRADAAEAGAADCVYLVALVRLLEVYTVENVEKLRAELQLPALAQRDVLEQAHVPGRLAGEAETCFAGVAELAQRGQYERRWINVVHARRRIAARARSVYISADILRAIPGQVRQ